MTELKIWNNPISNKIEIGKVKNGKWQGAKTDVTIEALLAVINHTLNFEEDVVIFREDGTQEFKSNIERD